MYAPAKSPDILPVHAKDLHESLAASRRIATTEPQAAFLLAFAALESAVRAVTRDGEGGSGRTFAADLNLLLERGVILQEDYEKILALRTIRSRISHGQIDLGPTAEQVHDLVETAELLIGFA